MLFRSGPKSRSPHGWRWTGKLVSLAIACLSLAGCRDQVASPAATPEVEESSLPSEASTPSLYVATLVAIAEADPSDPERTGEAAWDLYREAMLPIETEFGVSTVLDAAIVSTVGDCGENPWNRLLIQRYAAVSTLADVFRSPQRSEALAWWDPAVVEFHRVLGTPGRRGPAPTNPDEGVDRVLLVDARDLDVGRQVHSAEREALAPLKGEAWLEISIDPNLNEVDAQWDRFEITRYPNREALVEALASESLEAIRKHRTENSVRVCELLASSLIQPLAQSPTQSPTPSPPLSPGL
ncbi:MAG: hypothetical protein K8J08_13205 [Thermoanaerobaculia bacterium]|nr:hypothetical protein [Thermoanaerobaculia bacterium]